MSYDWNWFFSTLSQSAAALIGIIAAFLISRLIGLSEKASKTISDFDNLVIDFKRIVESLKKRKFYLYNYNLIDLNSNLKSEILENKFEGLSDKEILLKIYALEPRLYKHNKAVLDAFKEVYDECQNPKPINFEATKRKIDEISNERNLIESNEVEAKTLILQFEHNLRELKSFLVSIKPLKPLIIILMTAFPLTVIYPMHYMPVIENQPPAVSFNLFVVFNSIFTIKGILLGFFTVIIEGVFCYFLFLTSGIKRNILNTISLNSSEYKDIKKYSPCFGEK